ncbi:hypothetical protein P3S67_023360 [Capsicum chacoense]
MADMVPFTKERMWRKMLPYMITHAPLMLDTVLPKGVSKENIHHYRQLLLKYLTQIDESDIFCRPYPTENQGDVTQHENYFCLI